MTETARPPTLDLERLRELLLEQIRRAPAEDLPFLANIIGTPDDASAARPQLGDAVAYAANGKAVTLRDIADRSKRADEAIAAGVSYTVEEVEAALKEKWSSTGE